MNYSATDLSSKSGEILDTAQREPVTIQKHGRDFAFIISAQEMGEMLEARKLLSLQGAVKEGFAQIERGEHTTRTAREILSQVVQDRENTKRS